MSRFLNPAAPIARRVTVAVAGVAQSGPDLLVPEGVAVVCRAARTNTGVIKVADTAVNAQNAEGTNNFGLLQNQSISYQVQNSNALFFDATVAGEAIDLTFEY